jgi:hypothetical protein
MFMAHTVSQPATESNDYEPFSKSAFKELKANTQWGRKKKKKKGQVLFLFQHNQASIVLLNSTPKTTSHLSGKTSKGPLVGETHDSKKKKKEKKRKRRKTEKERKPEIAKEVSRTAKGLSSRGPLSGLPPDATAATRLPRAQVPHPRVCSGGSRGSATRAP